MPGQHKCPECDRPFKSKSALTLHVKQTHGEDPLAAVRNKIGVGAPRPGGTFSERPLKAAPSGIPSVDFAIGIGGVPRGTLIEVFGEPASGKTYLALTFSAYAQQQGGRAGYINAENAPMHTFMELIPGLDQSALEYGERAAIGDGSGEATLEASREYIKTGVFDVWTLDSVHSCVPRESLNLPIGDPRSMAALARLFNQALPIIDHDISTTDTLGVFVNHVKARPGTQFGRDWSKPAGSAFDYYASVQLKVETGTQYFNKDGRRIGHKVRVRVHKSKVAPPHGKAEFDLYYAEDTRIGKDGKYMTRAVTPGVDIPSSWFSVLQEAKRIVGSGGRYVDVQTSENLGSEAQILERLTDPEDEVTKIAHAIVYPAEFDAQAA